MLSHKRLLSKVKFKSALKSTYLRHFLADIEDSLKRDKLLTLKEIFGSTRFENFLLNLFVNLLRYDFILPNQVHDPFLQVDPFDNLNYILKFSYVQELCYRTDISMSVILN